MSLVSQQRFRRLVKRLRQEIRTPGRIVSFLLGYLYGAYLTIRYVDERECFPAIVFGGELLPLQISKAPGAKLAIYGRLRITPWLGRDPSVIRLGPNARVTIKGNFSVGDGVLLRVEGGGNLVLSGKRVESAAGITARSIIMVKRKVEIGWDALIAWDTFITDSDWHRIEGTQVCEDVVVDDHVWICNGAKVLKGARIGKDCIVGAGAVVNRGDYPPRSLIAGVPGKVVRSDIPKWHR